MHGDGVGAGAAGTAEARRDLIRSALAQVLNGRDWSVAPQFFEPDLVVHHAVHPEPMNGIDEFAEGMQPGWSAFPDWSLELVDVVVDGDRAMARTIVRGTHEGELFGIPATGKSFETDVYLYFRFGETRIREVRIMPDVLRQMQQLGLMPEGPPPKPMLLAIRLMNRLGDLRGRKTRSAA